MVTVLPLSFIGILWGIYFLNYLFNLDLNQYGLIPRRVDHLYGMITFPFLHGSLEHLWSNSVALFVCLVSLRYFFPSLFFRVGIYSLIIPGIITFIIARSAVHIGASGMVYSLVSFLFFSGILRSNRYLLGLSLFMVFLYGSMFWGMFPIEEKVSWEGHLSGGLTGLVLSLLFRKMPFNNDLIEPLPPEEKEADEDSIIGSQWKTNATGGAFFYTFPENYNKTKDE